MILHAVVAAQVAVVGPTGPVLENALPSRKQEIVISERTESDDSNKCLSRWRTVAYGAHAVDAVATSIGMKRSKLKEGNPVYKAIGLDSVLGVVAFKGLLIGATEFQVARLARRGKVQEACNALKVSGVAAGIGASLGIYYNFK